MTEPEDLERKKEKKIVSSELVVNEKNEKKIKKIRTFPKSVQLNEKAKKR